MELLFSDLGRLTLIYEKYRQILPLSNLCPLFKQQTLQRIEGGKKRRIFKAWDLLEQIEI